MEIARPSIGLLLELASLVVVIGVFIATVFVLQAGLVAENEQVWLAIIMAGTAVVVFWTVCYPLYDRYFRNAGLE